MVTLVYMGIVLVVVTWWTGSWLWGFAAVLFSLASMWVIDKQGD